MNETLPESEVKKKGGSASDHLANERTFLAWIRTSIAIMAFGFVVVKFALFIKQISFLVNENIVLPHRGYSAMIGITLVGLGAVMALLAYFRYRSIEKQLNRNTYFPSLFLSILLTVAIVIIGILLLIYLLPSL